MSVQTEISRLESAKQAIAAAIADKGVTVPSGTMLDGMAPLIESIVAGGGTDNGPLSLLDEGSFKLTARTGTGSYTIQHNAGVIPKVLVVSGVRKSTGDILWGIMYRVDEDAYGLGYEAQAIVTASTNYTRDMLFSNYTIADWTEDTITFCGNPDTPMYYAASKNYSWKVYG